MLDFGIGGVGVEAGRLLAEYGADVIKIETRAHPDFIRAIFGTEMNPSFASSSRCKRGFGINLRTAAGLEIIKRLIAVSDVVIENSATGTMEKLGLGFDQMREINPRIVLASSQLMGATGPWKDWIGFGPNSRTAGAMTWLWNFPEGGMPPGFGRDSSRSSRGPHAGSGSGRDACSRAIAAAPAGISKWRRSK